MSTIHSRRGRRLVLPDAVRVQANVPAELHTMLDQLMRSTGVSKGAIVREALAFYGEHLGLLPEGTTSRTIPTRSPLPAREMNTGRTHHD